MTDLGIESPIDLIRFVSFARAVAPSCVITPCDPTTSLAAHSGIYVARFGSQLKESKLCSPAKEESDSDKSCIRQAASHVDGKAGGYVQSKSQAWIISPHRQEPGEAE